MAIVTIVNPANGQTFQAPQESFDNLWEGLGYELAIGQDVTTVTVLRVIRKSTALWATDNPVLDVTEWGVDTDTGEIRLGDGVNNWADLETIVDENDMAAQLASYLDDANQVFADTIDALGELSNFTGDEYVTIEAGGTLYKVSLQDITNVASPNHASDTFIRADSPTSLGTADNLYAGGSQALVYSLTGGTGNLGIVSNLVVRSTTGYRYASVNTSSPIHGTKLRVANGGGNNGTVGSDGLRFTCRFASTSQHYLLYFVNGGGWRTARVSGSTTNIGTYYTGVVADGDTLELRANGNTIELLHNDAVVKTVDESVAIAATPALGTNTATGWALSTVAHKFDRAAYTNAAAQTFGTIVQTVEEYVAEVAGLRVEVADLATAVGSPALRTDWIDPITGLGYVGMIYADPTTGHGDAIQAAIDEAALTPDLSPTNRMMVLVPPGTYARTSGVEGDLIQLADYVDVRGATGDPADVIVTSSIDDDTIEAGGVHALLGYMTIAHTGAIVEYGIHVDTLADIGHAPELVMIGLVVSSMSKQACGIGTRRDQRIFAYDCSFTMANAAFNQAGLFLHNDSGGTARAYAAFVDCQAISLGNGSSSGGLTLSQQDSGLLDEFHWLGGTMTRGNVAANDLTIATEGGGTQSWMKFRIDTSAYSSSSVAAAGDLADVAWPLPTPTRMPARLF